MRLRLDVVIAVAMLAVLTACPSGQSVRGVEHPEAKRKAATCRGADTGAWVPQGFCVTRFAKDLVRPRHLVFAPNGDLLVATRNGIVVLWDADADGASDDKERAILGTADVSQQGVALSPDEHWVYVADSRAVRRVPYRAGLRTNEG